MRIIKNEEGLQSKTIVIGTGKYYQEMRANKITRTFTLQELAIAAKVLEVKPEEIRDISLIKKGMTNYSFLFTCKQKKYMMRVPGEGTDRLINRMEEAKVYQLLKGRDICDNVLYIDPHNGYKITEYMENVRTCNPQSNRDVCKCMKKLRQFHVLCLRVDHEFDLFRMIDFYESLRGNIPSIYPDYKKVKKKVQSLKIYIDGQKKEWALTHIDAVPDNFLIAADIDEKEDIRLIDWEYAGMQDPHVDIAMFCIYALYNRKQVDKLIQAYFVEGCDQRTRIKIYCYIAVCGLLWSNWCEYKSTLGIEFGEYASRQYQFAKDYYEIAVNEMKK